MACVLLFFSFEYMTALLEREMVHPGQRIGDASAFQCGPGAYCVYPHIFAAVLGCKEVLRQQQKTEMDNELVLF